MNSADSVIVKVCGGKAGFQALVEDWDGLALSCGTHFLHYPGWYGAELDALENDSHVFFAALYDGGKLFAVLPLERAFLRKGKVSVPVLQLFYPNEMGVNDVLSDRPLFAYRKMLLRALRAQIPYFAFIRWQCVLEGGCAVTLLSPGQRARLTHSSKYIDFSAGFVPFWESYRSKFRKDLQKKMRKAEAQGELRLFCAKEPEDLLLAFEDFLTVEDSGWKGEAGTSIRKQPCKLAYYRHLLDYYAARGLCQINLLYCNETPIAAQFGVRVGSQLFLLKIGYREDFATVSPGYLVLYKLVKQSADQGEINRVSFVTGVDWIDRWHPHRRAVGIFYSGNGSWYSALLVRALEKAVAIRDRRKTGKQVDAGAI